MIKRKITERGGVFIRREKQFFCGHLWEKGCRDKNQDSLSFWHMRRGKNHKVMAVLCDGIGGLEQGEEASSYVVRQLANWFMTEGYRMGLAKQQKMIQQLCFQIHQELADYGKENGIRLGTTIAVVLMENKKMCWMYTGDCRIYLLRDKRIKKLTGEHHDSKGNLTRAIGVGEWYLLTQGMKKWKKKDRILVCSDGFYRNLDKEELRIWNQRKVDSNAKADRMLKQIFQKKISAGERDNISALYFGYTEKQGEQA